MVHIEYTPDPERKCPMCRGTGTVAEYALDDNRMLRKMFTVMCMDCGGMGYVLDTHGFIEIADREEEK